VPSKAFPADRSQNSGSPSYRDLSLPAGLHEDWEALQQLNQVLLQQHRLMWRAEHPIPEGKMNALQAGYSCLTGSRLVRRAELGRAGSCFCRFAHPAQCLPHAQPLPGMPQQ